MKKKIFLLFVMSVFLFTLTACNESKKEEKVDFKKDYEEINGQTNSKGKVHRTVTIDKNNVFEETTPEEIVKMIENKETFYVYFGSRLCPWCRSVIEKADEISRANGIDKIYYVDIWDDEGNEIFRDKYELDENKTPVKKIEGTDAYNTLIKVFSDYLRNYTIKAEDGTEVNVGEKRIYAPNFGYVENGKAKRLISGKSELQKDSRGELTEEMLKDEEMKFDSFFINACDDDC